MAQSCIPSEHEINAPKRLSGRVAVAGIRLYQVIHSNHYSPCRYVPSCSHFAIEAISTYGLIRGGWMALRRVARCNPLGRYGFDPVPR